MPSPYSYIVPQPSVSGYFDAMRQGRADRQAQEADVRQTALSKYLPQALQGDKDAMAQVMANATPEQQIQFHQMNVQQQAQHVEQIGSILATVKDQPSLDAAKAAYLRLPGTSPEEVQNITLQDIPALLAQSQKAQAILAQKFEQDYKGKMLANDTSRTTAQNAQSYAAAAKDRAAAKAAAGDSDAYPQATLRAMAEQYLAGDKSVLQNLGRGKSGERAVKDLRNMIQSVAVEKGMTPTQIASKLAEYGGYQSGLITLAGRQANIDTAAQEADNFVDLSVAASNRVPRGSFVPLNQLVQAGQVMTSDPALADFAVKAMNLASAAATVAGRGTTNQFLQEEYFKQLATAPDAKAFEAKARAIRQEAELVRKSTRDVRGEMVTGFTGQPAAPAAPSSAPTILQYDAKGNRIK